MLYLQGIPKTFMLHAEQFLFWHLAPSQLPLYRSQGKHLLYRTFTCLFLFQSSRRAVLHHLLCPKMECQSHLCGCGLSRESSRNFQKRNGKTRNHWRNDAHGKTIKLSYSFCWTQPQGSQSTAGWGQSWIAGTFLPKIKHIVS